jgi:hypothetical protein
VQQNQQKSRIYQDEWGTNSRQGYEDRSNYRPKKVAKKAEGSRFIGSFGSLLIVGGMFWGTYLITSGHDISTLTHYPGPVHLAGAGIVVSILGRFLRSR